MAGPAWDKLERLVVYDEAMTSVEPEVRRIRGLEIALQLLIVGAFEDGRHQAVPQATAPCPWDDAEGLQVPVASGRM